MRVVILGGGHAGGATALALREAGFDGGIVVVGEERLPPYERPPLSKEALTEGAAPPALVTDWDARRIRLRLGCRGTAIDRVAGLLHLQDGSAEPFDRLVIATGGLPRRPPFAPHPAFLCLRTAGDAASIRAAAAGARRAVVLGGGVIGLEVAAALRGSGLDVAVIEMAPRVMGRNAPLDMAARAEALHRARGVAVILGHRARSLGADDATGELCCTLDDGRVLRADLVVAGIGIAPDVALAEAAGLAGPDGVPVDERYRTADPRVLAVGDIASRGGRREETWAHAQWSARAAARTILDLPEEPAPVPWFWTTQFGHTLQVAGDPLAADMRVARGEATSLYLRDGVLAGVAAWDAPRAFAQARRLIGHPLDIACASDAAVPLAPVLA